MYIELVLRYVTGITANVTIYRIEIAEYSVY